MAEDKFRRSFKMPFHNTLGLAVYNCGIQRCGPGHAWGPALRDHFLIHCITKGKGTFTFNGQSRQLATGDGFLVVPDRIVTYQANTEDPWEYCWVGFNGSDAKRWILQTGISEEEPVFHFGENHEIPDALQEICNTSASLPGDEARMQARLLHFLAALMDQYGSVASVHTEGYEYVQKAVHFIECNYSRDIGIDTVAASAGISRSHLYRLFMDHISISPNEYLTRHRIQKAVALLETGRFSVGEVAYSTGFSDQLYFSRVFKKYQGVPPSQYLSKERTKKEEQ